MLSFARQSLLIVLYVALWWPTARAHEGHDHGSAPAARASAPSAEARTDSFALSAVAVTGAVLLHLDHPASNEPLSGAQIEVETPEGPARAAPDGSGTYRLPAPWLKPGRQGLIATVSSGAATDVLPLVLDIPAGPLGGTGVPHSHADGTIAVPKATQRLFNIRTVVAAEATERVAIELMGRIVPDPQGGARVRAPRDGTIEPGTALHVGQRVGRGDVLAALSVVLPPAEELQLRQKLVEIEREQALLGPRAEHASVVNPNMPMGDAAVALLNEIQVQAQALTRQADLIKTALAQRIEIKAPIDGVVASSAIRAGELVATRDVLAEIVDPGKARVEAYAFAPVPRAIAGATAMTDDGRTLDLTYLGQGPMLRGQAVPLTFQVKVEEGIPVEFGAALRVHVKDGTTRQGIKLPRSAVQRSEGAHQVFEHVAAETFVPRRVTVEPLDAEHVLVTGEVAPGARLVTTGAVFIAQVR